MIAGLCGLLAIGLVGAYFDLRFRRLPNWLCLCALTGGLALGLAQHGPGWMGMSLLHALIALIGGMVLFTFRIIGGGDAKFYAGLAGWFPLKFGATMLAATALAGLVLSLVWLAFRPKPAAPVEDSEIAADFAKLPYGLAIAAGAIFTYTRIVV